MHEYRETGFPVTIVRPSHTYGETKLPVPLSGKVKGGWQVVDRIRRGKPVIVHGDGYSLWTLTHNSDFAKGFVGLMGNPHAIGEAVHITSDETVTWNCAFESLGRAIGVMPKMVHMSCDFIATHDPDQAGPLLGDRAHSVVFDNTKIKRLVPGFTATVRFDEGIRNTYQYILDHPKYQLLDPEFDAWCDHVIEIYEKAMRP